MQEIYEKFVDEIVLEIIFEAHREHRILSSTCQLCNASCSDVDTTVLTDVNKPGYDIYGTPITLLASNEGYDCFNCKRKFPSQRYALHLEKCLGVGNGRNSTRSSRRNNNFQPPIPTRESSTQQSLYCEIDASDDDDDIFGSSTVPTNTANNATTTTNTTNTTSTTTTINAYPSNGGASGLNNSFSIPSSGLDFYLSKAKQRSSNFVTGSSDEYQPHQQQQQQQQQKKRKLAVKKKSMIDKRSSSYLSQNNDELKSLT